MEARGRARAGEPQQVLPVPGDEPGVDAVAGERVQPPVVGAGVDAPEPGAADVAEFERELIRQRTEEGRQGARKRGVSFARPSKLRPDQRELATRLLREGRSV